MTLRTVLVGSLLGGALALTGCAATTVGTGVAASSTPGSTPRSTPLSAPAAPPAVPAARPAVVAKPRPEAPRPNPCATNTRAQLVRVSLRAQQLWMCAHRQLRYTTPITSGIVGEYSSTPTGTYEIQGVTRDTTLTLISGDTYAVKYWIPFDGPLFGFHDSSWQDFPYGSPKYRTEGSHGCVHMPLRAIAFLARWAEVGATVSIRS